MNRISFVCIATLICSATALAAPGGTDGEVFGEGVSEKETISTLELLNKPDDYVGKTIRVEGRIADVCPRKGCWIDIASDGSSETVRFKVEDDIIVFPMSTKGKHVVAEGTLVKHEMDLEASVRWARHLADEKGEEFDPASVPEPLTLYQIEGNGAVVRETP